MNHPPSGFDLLLFFLYNSFFTCDVSCESIWYITLQLGGFPSPPLLWPCIGVVWMRWRWRIETESWRIRYDEGEWNSKNCRAKFLERKLQNEELNDEEVVAESWRRPLQSETNEIYISFRNSVRNFDEMKWKFNSNYHVSYKWTN